MSYIKLFFDQTKNAAKSISLTRVALSALILICSLQFAAIFFFPDALPLQVASGNLAEWIAAAGGVGAAVGTIIIGIGANGYAREAALAGKARDDKEMRGRIATLFALATQLESSPDLFEKECARFEGEIAPGKLALLITYVARSVERHTPELATSKLHFPEYGTAIALTELAAANVGYVAEIARRDLKSTNKDNALQVQRDVIQAFRAQLANLKTPASFLSEQSTEIAGQLFEEVVLRWRDYFSSTKDADIAPEQAPHRDAGVVNGDAGAGEGSGGSHQA